MKKIYLFIFTIIILFSNSIYSQCSLYPVSLSSRVSNSSLIIEGKVISQKSFWNIDRNYIYTSNLISVSQTLKGNSNSSFIEIITEGGLVDLYKQVVEPSLQLNINDQGIFILNTFNQESQFGSPVFQAYADQQGFIKFNLYDNTATTPFKKYNDINIALKEFETILNINLPDFVNPNIANKFSSSSSIAAIGSISPLIITAGTASILTITGTGFGATQGASIVEFKNADDGGATYIQPHSSQYVSWSATQIQVMVPTRSGSTTGTAGTGPIRVTVGTSTVSGQTLTVDYGELNVLYTNTITSQAVFNTRHIDLNNMNGINWQMFTSFNANSAAKTAFLSAFQTWRCNTYINWLLGTTVTTNTIALDGVNVIRFDINNELPAGVLGRCTSYFNGCSFGPNVYFYVSELDICFDDPATSAITWNFGPALATGIQYDFESVAVHELGHGHQLSHVINTSDVMHYSIGQAQNKRTLIAADIAAGNDVMSRNVSAAICGKGNIVPITASLCSVSAPTSSFSIITPICVGQNVTLNSGATGGPTNFNWTMTGGSTTSSTLQNTSTSYPSAGIYSITLLATNGIGSSSLTKTISVIALPNVAVTSANVCSGNTGTLTASGASSYTWNPGALTGATQTLNPLNTQIYTVIGSNGTCTNTSNGTLSVTPTPTVSAAASTTLICTGQTTTLTASGATSYTFNPGAVVGNPVTFSPAANTTYSIIGKTNNCAGTAMITISVSLCTNISNNLKNSDITIYPNPTQGLVTINFGDKFSGEVNLYDVLGQLISSEKINDLEKTEVNLIAYPKGVYLIKLLSDNGKGNIIRIVRD